MAIEWQNTPTQWQNAGVEPSDTLKTNGYSGGDRPAADTFNHIFNNNYKCISEIQTQIENLSGESDPNVSNATGTLAIAHGGTGATSYYGARENLRLQIANCSSVDLLAYIKSLPADTTGYFMATDCTNTPNSTNWWLVSVLYNTGSEIYVTAAADGYYFFNAWWGGQWQGWKTFYSSSDSINADTLDGYHASSFSKTGQLHQAGQGLYNGYSFQNDGSNNTGMFSLSDDDLRLIIGSTVAMFSYDGRLVFPNGTVYVQESQPTAPNGSLWAW